MTTLSYAHLKNRVIALLHHVTHDDWGGYQEVWQAHKPLWAAIQVQKKHPDLKDSSLTVALRRHGLVLNIKGFYWKKWLLKVQGNPLITPCQRFVYFNVQRTERNAP